MVSVVRPADESQIEDWAAQISGINARARQSGIEKLDAAFIALTRSAEIASKAAVSAADGEADAEGATKKGASVDTVLNGLIDEYFAATEDPSAVVAENAEDRARRLSSALGGDYRTASAASGASGARGPSGATGSAGGPDDSELLRGDAVFSLVARLTLSPDWPQMPADDLSSVAHAAAQVLAGIGSDILPAKRWREHRCWGRFRGIGDFSRLEDYVSAALERLRASSFVAQRATAAPALTTT